MRDRGLKKQRDKKEGFYRSLIGNPPFLQIVCALFSLTVVTVPQPQAEASVNTFWINSNVSNNMDVSSNWYLGFPPIAGYIGVFSGSDQAPNYAFTTGGITCDGFNLGTHSWRLGIFGSSYFLVSGVNNSANAPQIFEVSGNGELHFKVAGCSADVSNTGLVTYDNSSFMIFESPTSTLSTASNATFNVTTSNGLLTFSTFSTAANADINVDDGGEIRFQDNIGLGTGGTAANATINASGGSSVNFNANGTAANAAITLFSGSSVLFSTGCSAGSAVMTADASTITFNSSAPVNSGNLAQVAMTNGSSLSINQTNKLQFLSSDQTSTVNLGANQLTITGTGQTMTIAGPVKGPAIGTGGALVFNNTTAGASNRTTTYLLRDSTAAQSYTGSTTVTGNNSLIGNTTSLANSISVNNSVFNSSATLTFDQDFNGIFRGTIAGSATTIPNAVTIMGGGEVQIPSVIGIPAGSSSVSLPLTIQNGILVGDTNSLLGNITLNDFNSKLIFRQSANGNVFSKNISSSLSNGPVGSVEVDSPGVTITVNDANTVNVGLVRLTAGNFTGKGDNLTSDFFLGNNTILTLTPATTTFLNDISGTGSVVVADKPGLGIIQVLGVNSYTGSTTLGANASFLGNSEALQGDFFLTNSLSGLIFDQSIGTNSPIVNGVYEGDISGNGAVIVQGGQTLTFRGTNTYNNGTIVSGATTSLVGTTNSLQGIIGLASNANLTFNQSFSGTYKENLIGTGTLFITGGGRVNMLGTNTFTGPITVTSGVLEGNTASIQQDILNNDTVQFTQLANGTYTHTITGIGNLIKAGPAKLAFVSPQIAANTYIQEGELNLNTTLTGNGIIESGGRLTGVGTITGDLTLKSGGMLKPGNSIGTMTVGGNYLQELDSVYAVQVDGLGNSTDTLVAGTVFIEGGEVDLTSPDGTFLLNHPYQILHSNLTNGLTGTFSEVNAHGFFNPNVVKAIATYDPQNAYLVLETSFENCVGTQNQENIAFILDNWINPPADIEALLQVLVTLPCDEINFVLDEMSGEQYATEMTVADMTNRKFIRRLFDPLRVLMRTAPCYENYFTENCCRNSVDAGHSMWVEGGASRINIENSHEGYGVNTTGYEVVGGIQHTFDYDWTLGLGVGYFQDNLKFKLPGHGNMRTVDVGLYGLYRPEAYYVLGDLTFGVTTDKVTRRIRVAEIDVETHANTHLYLGTFYGEVGFDYIFEAGTLGCLVAQPFVGFELGYTHRNTIHEKEGGSFDLVIGDKDFFRSSSRLGVHLNTIPDVGQMRLSLDLAWLYRFANSGRTNETRFAAIGSEFDIAGVPEQKSSFEGILNLTVPAGDFISFYLEAVGQVWQTASSCSALGGIQANW